MRDIIAKLIQRLGIAERADVPPASDELTAEAYAQPRIEPGSSLDTMAELNPATAMTYAEAVAHEIELAIAGCTLGDSSTPDVDALEQIHSLKNAIAPTGSPVLLKACDDLRRDVGYIKQRPALEQRFRAVANAASLLVKNYQRTLPTNDSGKHG